MDELPHARIPAVEFLQELQHQRKSAAAVVLVQEQGVRHTPAFHHLMEGIHHFRIPIHHHIVRSPT